MSTPLVRCASCERTWNSETMAEGLRMVPGCPRCGGELVFSDAAPAEGSVEHKPASDHPTAPHLVLGVPRR